MRSIWQGSIKLGAIGLFSIPVKLYVSREESARVEFNSYHRGCNARLKQQYVCSSCQQVVNDRDTIKGHTCADKSVVFVEPDDIKALKVDSMHTITLDHFTPVSAIDVTAIDRMDYLGPQTTEDGRAFAILRDALGDKAGIGRYTSRGKEHTIAVVARDRGLAMYTLTPSSELRAINTVPLIENASGASQDELSLAAQLVAKMTKPMPSAPIVDSYNEAVKQLVASKATGQPSNVVSITSKPSHKPSNAMDALRAALSVASASIDAAPVKKAAVKRPKKAKAS